MKTRIYILYNYELYKLKKKYLYVQVFMFHIFLEQRSFSLISKKLFLYNYNKNLYNKYEFLKNYYIIFLKSC